MTLMERLFAAGYPKEDIFPYYSDIDIYATRQTQAIINQWCRDNNYARYLFVECFRSQTDNKPMYRIAFAYDDYWREISQK